MFPEEDLKWFGFTVRGSGCMTNSDGVDKSDYLYFPQTPVSPTSAPGTPTTSSQSSSTSSSASATTTAAGGSDTAPHWAQCGGNGWTGATTVCSCRLRTRLEFKMICAEMLTLFVLQCASPYTCVKVNDCKMMPRTLCFPLFKLTTF